MEFALIAQAGTGIGMGHLVRSTTLLRHIRSVVPADAGPEDRPSIGIVDLPINSDPFLRDLKLRQELEHIVVIVGVGWSITPDTPTIADLVIYQQAHEPPADILEVGGDRILYGPKYLILDPRYASLRRVPMRERQIVVYIGGGISRSYIKRTDHALRRFGARTFFAEHFEDSLVPHMREASLMVCSMGMTVYEAMTAGVPVICVSRSEDHAQTAEKLQGRYGELRVMHLGLAEAVSPIEIKRAVEQRMLHALDIEPIEGFDGLGVERVAQEIIKMSAR